MLQLFDNAPIPLTHIALNYLTFEEMFAFMALPEDKLYSLDSNATKKRIQGMSTEEERIQNAGLTKEDKANFRAAIQGILPKFLQLFREKNMRIISSNPTDAP